MILIIISILLILCILCIEGRKKYKDWDIEDRYKLRQEGMKDVIMLIIELFGQERGKQILIGMIPMTEEERVLLKKIVKEKWNYNIN